MLHLMAILQDCGPKFKSCKIFQLYTNLTRYLTRFLKEKHFLQDFFLKNLNLKNSKFGRGHFEFHHFCLSSFTKHGILASFLRVDASLARILQDNANLARQQMSYDNVVNSFTNWRKKFIFLLFLRFFPKNIRLSSI